jgi:lipoate-protein ligase A
MSGGPFPSAPYPFRLLSTDYHDGYYNMGLDEALLERVARGESPPALRFYGWRPPAVSVGYFQGLEEELDLEACKRRGVDLIRRITGGGAVFHQGELTYSIIMPLSHPLAGDSIRGSYRVLCAGIIRGLERLGIAAEFSPINDILAGGRKVSGNAQTRRMNTLLQHGTILLENDPALMFELLRVPPEKLRGKFIAAAEDRVTSLRRLLGRPVSFDEARDAMAGGFREALSLLYNSPLPEAPAPEEDARARELGSEKFSSPGWLYMR